MVPSVTGVLPHHVGATLAAAADNGPGVGESALVALDRMHKVASSSTHEGGSTLRPKVLGGSSYMPKAPFV